MQPDNQSNTSDAIKLLTAELTHTEARVMWRFNTIDRALRELDNRMFWSVVILGLLQLMDLFLLAASTTS